MAQRVTWRGKHTTMLTVGKSNWCDFSTIGSALDSITDAASDNRYVIMLAHDRTSEQVDWNKSYVDLAGESRWWSIIQRPKEDATENPKTGGTIQVASDGGPVVDCGFYNLRVVRDQSGALLGGGAPPEAGFFVGDENVYPSSLYWDRITIADCVIEGVHDGLQVFGQRFDYTGTPSRITCMNNQIRCCHDALTYKGLVQATHVGEDIRVRSQGFDPYLTNVAEWKHTGLHVNFQFAQASPAVSVEQKAFIHLTGCLIDVEDGSDINTSQADQGVMAGVYLYDLTGNAQTSAYTWNYPVRITDCSITVRNTQAITPLRGVGGVMVWQGSGSDGSQIPANSVVVSGGSITVDQTHASGPSTVAGVWLHGADNATSANTINVTGCSIYGTNAAGSAYSLQADTQSDTIVAKVFSDLATNIDAAATATAATTRP